MPNGLAPQRTRGWAMRVVYVTAPLTLIALVVWVSPLASDHDRLVFGVYQLLLLLTIGAGTVAAVAAGQLAIAKAFTAGYVSGVRAAVYDDGDGDGSPKHRRGLRAVE